MKNIAYLLLVLASTLQSCSFSHGFKRQPMSVQRQAQTQSSLEEYLPSVHESTRADAAFLPIFFPRDAAEPLEKMNQEDSARIAEYRYWKIYRNVPWVNCIKVSAAMRFMKMSRDDSAFMRRLLRYYDTITIAVQVPTHARIVVLDSLPPTVLPNDEIVYHFGKTLFLISPDLRFFYSFSADDRSFDFRAYFLMNEAGGEIVDPKDNEAATHPANYIQKKWVHFK